MSIGKRATGWIKEFAVAIKDSAMSARDASRNVSVEMNGMGSSVEKAGNKATQGANNTSKAFTMMGGAVKGAGNLLKGALAGLGWGIAIGSIS